MIRFHTLLIERNGVDFPHCVLGQELLHLNAEA